MRARDRPRWSGWSLRSDPDRVLVEPEPNPSSVIRRASLTPTGTRFVRKVLIDELGAEFVTDAPCQPTLARAAFGHDDRELGRNVEMFSDDLHAADRYIRDRAVSRQRTSSELYLRETSAQAAFALTSIH